MIRLNELWADVHKHFATHDAHGYTQGAGRWGGGKTETVRIQRWDFKIGHDDGDCSSTVIMALRAVLHVLGGRYSTIADKATYTGNMRSILGSSALFDVWKYNAANLAKAQRGDILLNDNNHTGMIQSATTCSEALISEKGTITGGKIGDQTGREICIRNISAYGKWQWILHYNGKADIQETERYKVIKRTNVRVGRSLLYRAVGKVQKGEVVTVDRVVIDKFGRIWGHIGKYRWFVICTKSAARALKIID